MLNIYVVYKMLYTMLYHLINTTDMLVLETILHVKYHFLYHSIAIHMLFMNLPTFRWKIV